MNSKIWLTILGLTLAACAPIAPPSAKPIATTAAIAEASPIPTVTMPAPVPTLVETVVVKDPPAALKNMRTMWQQWTGEENAANLTDIRKVEWSDSCLGAGLPNESCMVSMVPGWAMSFTVNGGDYVIHTDNEAYRFRVAHAPEVKIGEPIVAWQGGTDAEESVCGEIAIGVDGMGFGKCGHPNLPGRFITLYRRGELMSLKDRYAAFEAETAVGKVQFNGKGSEQAGPSTQRLIAEMAKQIYFEANAGRTSASAGQVLQYQFNDADGRCQVAVARRTGEIMLMPCQGGEPIQYQLDSDQLTQLYGWIDNLALFSISEGQNSLSFDGRGKTEASAKDQADMKAWLEGFVARAQGDQIGAFDAAIRSSLASRDYAAMQKLMYDPFAIGHWQSEGEVFTPDKAVAALKEFYLGDGNLTFEEYDIQKLGITSAMPEGLKLVRSLMVGNWGKDGNLHAVVNIAQRTDGSYVWYNVIVIRGPLP